MLAEKSRDLVTSVLGITGYGTIPYPKIIFVLVVTVALVGSFWPRIEQDTGTRNQYVHQARAILQGRLDIDQQLGDVAIYNGRSYVPFPPFPALLLLPLVAIFGVAATKPVLISLILTALNVLIFREILKKLEVEARIIPWVTAAFFLGTAYWLAALWSRGVWFFALVVSVTCLFLAFNEALGKGRGILVGLFLGMAIMSRQITVYMIIFLAVALWENPRFNTHKRKTLNLVALVMPLGLWLAGYLWFNWMRFGHPLETGYTYIYDAPNIPDFLAARVEKYGLFHPAYIPFNFINMFLQGFHVKFKGATYLSGAYLDRFGTSLTFASPFIFIAFWATWKRRLLLAAWISIGLALTHILLYHANGWRQVNAQRYSLDFLPLVILLVALGISRMPKQLWQAVIIYSVLLNVLALYLIPLWGSLY